jgi:hypothetical protein
LYSSVRHHTLPISTGFVEISAGLTNVKAKDPRSVPSASLKAWQVMPARGRVAEEMRLRPQMDLRSRGR